MFHFRFVVVYRPIYALGRILNLGFFFFFQYYVFGYLMNLVTFLTLFPHNIQYINHARIGINTALCGDCGLIYKVLYSYIFRFHKYLNICMLR